MCFFLPWEIKYGFSLGNEIWYTLIFGYSLKGMVHICEMYQKLVCHHDTQDKKVLQTIKIKRPAGFIVGSSELLRNGIPPPLRRLVYPTQWLRNEKNFRSSAGVITTRF